MKWLNKLERRFGHLAIKNLMLYIVFLNSIVFLLVSFDRSFLMQVVLIPDLVLQGEVWRLLTYIFIPPSFNLIFAFFVFYFYYIIGTTLENTWGSFKFNVYYFIGIIATTIVAFYTRGTATSFYLNLTLFLAFAKLYPSFQVYLFFIIPIKIKYLAWIIWSIFTLIILIGTVPARITVIVALSNYFLFFAKDIWRDIKLKQRARQNQNRFYKESGKNSRKQAMHKCTVCGITEKDDPQMDFRYCSKCTGTHEYCRDHLKNHDHL
ncbi:rhomboid family intramembrane serine protease [Natronospora cellulosivora (SeqCode)]